MKSKAAMKVVNDEPQTEPVNEQLIKKTPLENTPFITVSIDNVHFGTFGQYKITEDKNSVEEVETELKEMTWNRLIQIMTLVNTMLNPKTT